jgi:hypothetical protein
MPKKYFLGILSMALVLTLVSTSCDKISGIGSSMGIGNVATTESITYSMSLGGNDGVTVNIKPTSNAKPDIPYQIDLYESGRFREVLSIGV